MQICPLCGKTEIEGGSVVTGVSGQASILTKYAGVLFLCQESKKGKFANIYATTCLNCGHVELHLNPNRLK